MTLLHVSRLNFDRKLIHRFALLDYIIEAEPLVNKFISVPKDKGHLNCASFVGGIIEGILVETNFVS